MNFIHENALFREFSPIFLKKRMKFGASRNGNDYSVFHENRAFGSNLYFWSLQSTYVLNVVVFFRCFFLNKMQLVYETERNFSLREVTTREDKKTLAFESIFESFTATFLESRTKH